MLMSLKTIKIELKRSQQRITIALRSFKRQKEILKVGLLKIVQITVDYFKAGVAKPLPGGKKVPAKAFSCALKTFLKITFFKPYLEICKA